MAVTKHKSTSRGEDVVLTELKQRIVDTIKGKHEMTVTEFAYSRTARSLKIKPESLSNYLSKSGSTSFPVLQKLCKYLEIGDLKKRTKVKREVTYTIQ